jgi:hypothetical protein
MATERKVGRRGVLWGVLGGVLGGVFGGGAVLAAGGAGYKGYEAPPYRVERAEGAVELRAYAPHLVAEVTVGGDRSAAVGTGFRILAGYIFGGNAEGREIAMTVPVSQTPELPAGAAGTLRAAAEGPWTVRFMMPSEFRPSTLPPPEDGRIRFVTTRAERQIVARFSGFPSTGAFERQAAALREMAAAWGVETTGAPHLYYYDDPFTLPWNRRNEIAYTLR